MIYNERVRAIATEMAVEKFKREYNFTPVPVPEQKVKEFLPAARIAVKYMAEVATRAYMIGRSYDNPLDRAGLNVTLRHLGLIPDQEAGEE